MSERFSPLRRLPWRSVFEVSTTLVMIALAVALLVEVRIPSFGAPPSGTGESVRIPSAPIAITARPTLGAATARVAIVEYSDFQCPFCGVAARDILPAVIRDYVNTGKVILVFKHLPLNIHPFAPGAAASAFCADQQGKFWPMHDRLFREGIELTDAGLRTAASQIDLDLARYDSCRAGTATKQLVEADPSEAGG